MAVDPNRVSAIDDELLGLHSRMGELLAERATLAQTLGAGSLAGAEVSVDWFKPWAKDEYNLTITALGELGFSKKEIETNVPAYEQVSDGLTGSVSSHLSDRRRAFAAQDELLIVPSIQSIGLNGISHKPGLIPRFDAKQSGTNKTWVWEPLWRQFDDKGAIHDNGAAEAFSTAVLLGDVTDPRPNDEAKKANDYDEVGLVYTGMNVTDQRVALKHETAMHKELGRELSSATIAHIFVANAKRRLEGKPLLDTRTFTRLPHYPDMVAGGDAYVPSVRSGVGRLRLDGSDVQDDWDNDGVRRVLGVPVKA